MTTGTVLLSLLLALSLQLKASAQGRGMPEENRKVIRGLFDAHASFKREVTETEDGYVSKTTSDRQESVKLLQTHVKQMEKRLKKGLMVRRWDPAYAEFVNYYDDIEIKIERIENGISVTARGKTEAARKVARNHAGIVSRFIEHGWAEHDKRHPAVVQDDNDEGRRSGGSTSSPEKEGAGK